MIATLTDEEFDDFKRRGKEAYARLVVPTLMPEDKGKFVAIDATTGDYEIDPNDYEAVSRLHDRVPGAKVWLECVGFSTPYRFAGAR